jgi:hypothetical protein
MQTFGSIKQDIASNVIIGYSREELTNMLDPFIHNLEQKLASNFEKQERQTDRQTILVRRRAERIPEYTTIALKSHETPWPPSSAENKYILIAA